MVEHEPDDPFIKSTFEMRGPLFVVLVIRNIGKTAAVDARLEVSLTPSDFKRTLLLPLLMPAQKVRTMLAEGNINVLMEKYTTLRLSGEYRNISGKEIKVDDTIEVKRVLKSWNESELLLEETTPNRLSQIANRIDRLERSISRMLAAGQGVLVKSPEDQKKEREELKRDYEAEVNKEKGKAPS